MTYEDEGLYDFDAEEDFFYFGNCTASTGENIWALRESEEEVSWEEFLEAVPQAREFLIDIGATDEDTTDEQIVGSWFLDFFRGIHRGREAYFFTWSGYEWIWEGEEADEEDS